VLLEAGRADTVSEFGSGVLADVLFYGLPVALVVTDVLAPGAYRE